MSEKTDETLRRAFGVLYKKQKFDNFRILCQDAERLGYTQAMECYGEVALRLATEIQHEAK